MNKLLVALLFFAGCAPPPPAFARDRRPPDAGAGGGSETTTDPGTGGAPETATPSDGGGGAEPATASACVSPGACEWPLGQSDCDALGWIFEPDSVCPSQGLVGCCGDLVQYGGAWACYYDTAPVTAAAAKSYCALWQEGLP